LDEIVHRCLLTRNRRRPSARPEGQKSSLGLHMESPKLSVRVDLGAGRALGPGKIRLLEAIDKTGSISGAGRELGMSYRHAWELLDDLESCFRAAVVKPHRGGAFGGGATLAPLGKKLVKLYRDIEAESLSVVSWHLRELEVSLKRSTASAPTTSIKRPLRKRKVRRPKRAA
jgi:molybdate transport system regulatory protein